MSEEESGAIQIRHGSVRRSMEVGIRGRSTLRDEVQTPALLPGQPCTSLPCVFLADHGKPGAQPFPSREKTILGVVQGFHAHGLNLGNFE